MSEPVQGLDPVTGKYLDVYVKDNGDGTGSLVFANGRSVVAPAYTRIQDGAGSNLATVSGFADGATVPSALWTGAFLHGWNGASWDRIRTTNATTGIGQLLATIAGQDGTKASVDSNALRVGMYDPIGSIFLRAFVGTNTLQSSDAGRTNATIAAAAVAGAIKVGAGRAASVLVTSAGGTAAVPISDGAAGPVIGYVPANAAIGTDIRINRSFATSLYAGTGAGSPALTLSYD
ncbi:MAG: hypothetical protein NVSMB19_16000 [Vulcanimicrobiaceae bacterium]